jgi:hypothetical protein
VFPEILHLRYLLKPANRGESPLTLAARITIHYDNCDYFPLISRRMGLNVMDRTESPI